MSLLREGSHSPAHGDRRTRWKRTDDLDLNTSGSRAHPASEVFRDGPPAPVHWTSNRILDLAILSEHRGDPIRIERSQRVEVLTKSLSRQRGQRITSHLDRTVAPPLPLPVFDIKAIAARPDFRGFRVACRRRRSARPNAEAGALSRWRRRGWVPRLPPWSRDGSAGGSCGNRRPLRNGRRCSRAARRPASHLRHCLRPSSPTALPPARSEMACLVVRFRRWRLDRMLDREIRRSRGSERRQVRAGSCAAPSARLG